MGQGSSPRAVLVTYCFEEENSIMGRRSLPLSACVNRLSPLPKTLRLNLLASVLVAVPLAAQAQNGFTTLGTLGGAGSDALAVSANGTVVVGRADAVGAAHAFRWSSGGMNDINPPGSSDSYATAVSSDGSVIVGQADLGGVRAPSAGVGGPRPTSVFCPTERIRLPPGFPPTVRSSSAKPTQRAAIAPSAGRRGAA